MNIEFQTIGELFCGPGGGGLSTSNSKLVLADKTIRIRHLWRVILGGKITNQASKEHRFCGY